MYPGLFPAGAVMTRTSVAAWAAPNQCTDATTAADQITCFSQVWNNPMVLAPGALIVAAGIEQGGTSQASPHVAGAVRLHDAVHRVRPAALTPIRRERAPELRSADLDRSSIRACTARFPPRLRLRGSATTAAASADTPTVTTSPRGRQVGASVVIAGTDFTGATAVTFNGASAAFVVDSPTQITTSVPAGAATGSVGVTTGLGTGTSASAFVVQHARDVSLHFSKAKGNVTVLDGFSSCASGVPVKLQIRGSGGGFRTVASGLTKPSGAYNLGTVISGEKYRVIAKPTTSASGDKCLKDISPTVTA
jgi:uncharacterized protein (TIGR03437 family)